MVDINLLREDKGNDPERIGESQHRAALPLNSSMKSYASTRKEWHQRRYELDCLRKDFIVINKEIAQLKIVSSLFFVWVVESQISLFSVFMRSCRIGSRNDDELSFLVKAKRDATEKIKCTNENKKLTAEKMEEVQQAKMVLEAKLMTIGNLVHIGMYERTSY